jgi:Trk K+ transport system NAD-binding subunit
MASLSAFSVTLGASSRVLFALGRDGHVPEIFSRLHGRYRTPHVALFVCAGLVLALSALGVVRFLASVSSFGYLVAIGIVNYAGIALRRRMPALRRPFRVALYPVAPILGVIACWFFVPMLETRSLLLGGGMTAVGCALYLSSAANREELRGMLPSLRRLRLRIRAYWRPDMHVVIIGGGEQGANIADRLLAQDEFRMVFRSSQYQITFIEKDADRCEELGSQYGVPVFHGDGTRQEVLEQTEPDKVDVAVAAMNHDDKNAIAALQAKRLGIERVIAIARDPEYIALLEDSGVVCISAPYATAAMVENYLDRPGVAELFEIETGVASLMDLEIPEDGAVVGRKIRDIDVPEQCVVAAVLRDDEFVVPRGDTGLQAGDHVVLVGPRDQVKAAHDAFTRTPTGSRR